MSGANKWGTSDAASNSVFWGVVNAKLRPNTVNRTAFYNNVTPDAYIPGLTLGQFGVDPTEMGVLNGPVNQVTITGAGTGYGASGVTSVISGGGGLNANVTFTSTGGRLSGYTINNGGSSYETNPTVTVSAPALYTFNGNTAVGTNTITIASANTKFTVGDELIYAGNTTSTPYPLVDKTHYYVVTANSTTLRLSATPGGAAITFTGAPVSATAGGATLQGINATAVAITGGALHKGVAHAGWVVRKVGSGGRAGRVQYETLVAMGSMDNANDGSDDTILPDS
jgi:hypothetical protein